jgi:pimeloyl-ACP methyl ester carboxylesterase
LEKAMDAALFQEPRRRMIQLRDGEMAALDFGDAARPVDVVFAHANGFNAMTYRSILGPLSLSLRIIAMDQRGHGASRLPADPKGRRSWSDLRDDLLALLETLGDGPVILAGHSMGATTSLLAARERPDRVRGLVLFDPVVLPRLASAILHRAPWLATQIYRRMRLTQGALRRRAVFDSFGAAFRAYRGRGAFRTWPEIMLADYVAGGFREREDGTVELSCAPAWEASNFAAQGNDTWRALDGLRAPIDIYQCATQSVCQIRARSGVYRRNPQLRLHTVPRTTHFLPMERPDLVRDALLNAAEA